MNLFTEIDQAILDIKHGWTSPEKGRIMASMIVALRPAVSVEIGVYAGKGLVSLALAHKYIGFGQAVGIDPYDAKASLEGQGNAEDRDFWAATDYPAMMALCKATMSKYGCNNFYRLLVQRSDRVQPPPAIGVLRIDGNHGDMAVNDCIKWAPRVQRGGFVFIDDLEWTGKAPTRAANWLLQQPDYKKLYHLDDGLVFQRV